MSNRPDEPRPDEAGIEDLLRQVGARDEPSPAMEREVYTAVHAEWRALLEERRRKRRNLVWGVAASFALLVLVGTFGLRLLQGPPELVAIVARIDGTLAVDPEIGAAATRTAGERIAVGERVSTDRDSRAALTLGRSLSLRLDHETAVTFAANDTLTLEAGTVYVDDPPGTDRTPLTIKARAGTVTHVGTQYAVRHTNSGIEVSVREGRVLVMNSAGTSAGVAGDQLHVTEAGEVTRRKIAADDELWSWAQSAGPMFEINDRSLAAFLDWVARETGRDVVYETPVAKAAADQAMLHGSIAGLDLDTALTTVLSTTELRQYPAGDRQIGIRLVSAAPRARN
jgi:ferric-dicitrate binding protein FerR (iron transport regulator)